MNESTEPISTKPYFLRALYEWCVDNGYTPYVSVVVDAHTRVPQEYVRDGEIVLNVGPLAANRLKMGNELIEFSARFNGAARELVIPVAQVAAIYARENGQGMSFAIEGDVEIPEPGSTAEAPAEGAASQPGAAAAPSRADASAPEPPVPPSSGGKPTLRVIK